MSEMKHLEPERAVLGAEERLVAAKADIPPAIKIELRQGLGQGRRVRLEGRIGKLARPLENIFETEAISPAVLRPLSDQG